MLPHHAGGTTGGSQAKKPDVAKGMEGTHDTRGDL